MLSEALSPLSELGKSGGESEKHLRAQRVIISLSGFSLTHAKHKNGAKQAFEDRKPFLRMKLEKSRESANSERRKHNRGKKQSKEAKNLTFEEDLRFRSNF